MMVYGTQLFNKKNLRRHPYRGCNKDKWPPFHFKVKQLAMNVVRWLVTLVSLLDFSF